VPIADAIADSERVREVNTHTHLEVTVSDGESGGQFHTPQ